MRMCESEFIEVVDVGDPKVERCQENDVLWRDLGKEVEGNEHGSKENFLSDWSNDVVAVANPAAEGLGKGMASNPFSPPR